MTQPTLLVGHHYQTRRGGVARVVTQLDDFVGSDCEFIGVVVQHQCWPVPYTQSYYANGQVLEDGDHDDDLVTLCPPPRKPVTGWVNVYKSGMVGVVHPTRACADKATKAWSSHGDTTVATVFVKECGHE